MHGKATGHTCMTLYDVHMPAPCLPPWWQRACAHRIMSQRQRIERTRLID